MKNKRNTTMEAYLLQEHWATLVRKFKDVERDGAERMTNDLLDYVRYASIRQYKLFQQKRGEEFERMFLYLEKREHDVETVSYTHLTLPTNREV